MKRNSLAIVYALLAVVMWSTVATAFKLSLEWLTVLQLTAGACFFSTIVLGVCLAIRNELGIALTSLSKSYRVALLLGALNPFLYYLVLLKAYSLLPAQVAQSINYTWAITLMLLSVVILQHQIKREDFVGAALSYVGVIFVSFAGKSITGEVNYLGIALALGSTLIWALYWLFNAKDNRPPLIKLFQSFLLALPMLLITAYFVDGFPENFAWEQLASVAYIGFFEMGFSFIFWQMALHYADSVSRVSTLIFLSPLLSLVIIQNVLNEPITLLTLVGLCLIIIGVLYQQFRR